MKLHVVNTAAGLVPCNDADYEVKRRLKTGAVYEADIKMPRNYRFHKKYFALINCAWEYLDERQTAFFKGNRDVFRKSMEIAAGWCEPVYDIKGGRWTEQSRSISFGKMKEADFSELYGRVKDVLFSTVLKDIDEKEFLDNLINF